MGDTILHNLIIKKKNGNREYKKNGKRDKKLKKEIVKEKNKRKWR